MYDTRINMGEVMEVERVDSIRRSTREIIQHLGYLNHLFAHIGSISQCYALQKLETKRLTLLELSDELALDRSTVSRLAKDLVTKGYCSYAVHDKDRRSRYLELTELGREKLTEIHAVAKNQVQSAIESLNNEEQELISKGLALYAKALKVSPVGGK
ncbi:MAG: helix-turn-helix domain-containing protein [Verrucomicrobia bacterium]|nr:helix-turn-helix domain-containing protein [Verrucomicrobiota bacterium]